jgi:hypothetical protein
MQLKLQQHPNTCCNNTQQLLQHEVEAKKLKQNLKNTATTRRTHCNTARRRGRSARSRGGGRRANATCPDLLFQHLYDSIET